MLQQLRRDVVGAAPLAVVLGGAIGAFVTQWLLEPLRLSTPFALETTTLANVQIVAPLVVNLIWIGCCVPQRVQLAGRIQPSVGRHLLGARVATAMLGSLLLLPYFLLAVVLASVMLSPRPDLSEQLPLFLGTLTPERLGSAMVRTAVFAAASACLAHAIGKQSRRHPERLPNLISLAIVCCALGVVALEALWLTVLPPAALGLP